VFSEKIRVDSGWLRVECGRLKTIRLPRARMSGFVIYGFHTNYHADRFANLSLILTHLSSLRGREATWGKSARQNRDQETWICVIFSTANPIWGDIFGSSKLKARTSLLPGHASVKRDVGALSFELWNSIRKCHLKWDRLYLASKVDTCNHRYLFFFSSRHSPPQ